MFKKLPRNCPPLQERNRAKAQKTYLGLGFLITRETRAKIGRMRGTRRSLFPEEWRVFVGRGFMTTTQPARRICNGRPLFSFLFSPC